MAERRQRSPAVVAQQIETETDVLRSGAADSGRCGVRAALVPFLVCYMPLANVDASLQQAYASTDRIAGVVKNAILICIDAAADLCRDVQTQRVTEEHSRIASPTHSH